MLAFHVDDIKGFMGLLLRSDVFDTFRVRSVELQTHIYYKIDCLIDKEFYPESERAGLLHKHCAWSEIKPLVLQLIKGSRLPRLIRIVVSLDDSQMSALSADASAMFININFVDGRLFCTTGCSEKTFSLENRVEPIWEDYVQTFLNKNNIAVSTHDE